MEDIYLQLIIKSVHTNGYKVVIWYILTNDEITALFREVQSVIEPCLYYSFKALALLTKDQLTAIRDTFDELGIHATCPLSITTANDRRIVDTDGLREKLKMVKDQAISLPDFISYIDNTEWTIDEEPTEEDDTDDEE